MKTMTPSTEAKSVTESQINKAIANYRAMLEKHAPEFEGAAVQTVLGSSEFAKEQLTLFRRHVEAQSNIIMRHVRVDRSRKPQAMLDATGRAQYTDKDVVKDIPRETAEEADVYFFRLGRNVSCADLEKEYEIRGLKPDPYAQAAVNEADPTFADEHPNGSQWKDDDDKWCYIAFRRWDGGKRDVRVYRSGLDWDDDWWFAGVRK